MEEGVVVEPVEACGAGSDSGVETCGGTSSARALSSNGSACGSESSSLASLRSRRIANGSSRDGSTPRGTARPGPLGSSTPRVVPRAPHLATKERARSRDKPTVPEKPRHHAPPAPPVKQTRTSAARCRPLTPPDARAATLPRRQSVARAASCRAAPRPRVLIYAEVGSQTALTASDVTAALAGREVRISPVTESRAVQAERYDDSAARLAEERARRERLEKELEEERERRRVAQDELAAATRRLLESAGNGECSRALGEQLRAADERCTQHRTEIDSLRATCNLLQQEARDSACEVRVLSRRLAEVEREAAEMQDFLSAEKQELQHTLRETERELDAVRHELIRRRAECRQLVRLSEQRRQEALTAAARGSGEGPAIEALGRRLRALIEALGSTPVVSRSCSEGGRSPDDPELPASHVFGASASWCCSERSDDSAELLDSETEPPGLEAEWSADVSPVRSDRDSLQELSAAILQRQRSESEPVRHKVVELEALVTQLARIHLPDSQELSVDERWRAARYEAVDACLGALSGRQDVVVGWPRLAALQANLESLAFALLPPTANSHMSTTANNHTPTTNYYHTPPHTVLFTPPNIAQTPPNVNHTPHTPVSTTDNEDVD